jgi:predicted nucleic acid-binding protein
MKIVADTNTFLAVALNEPEKPEIIRLTTGHQLIAPEVLPFEIGNALTAMMKRHILDVEEVTSGWDSSLSIQVELYRTNIREALELATKFNIYAYDAYFLECATNLNLPLLTLDRQLRNIAIENGTKIIEVST